MDDKEKKSQIPQKKNHPKTRVSYISQACFGFDLPLLTKGYKNTINEADLYNPLGVHEAENLGNVLERNWKTELTNSANPSLSKVLIRTYMREFYPFVLLLCIHELGVKMLVPLLIGKVLSYFNTEQNNVTLELAYLYAAAVVCLSGLSVWLLHFSLLGLAHLAMKARIACSSLIYRKTLKLSRQAMGKHTIGHIITLLANDVAQFEYLLLHFHQMILAPVQIFIVLYLLYTSVHPSAMTGMVVLLTFVPIQMLLGRLTMYYRQRTAKRTDKRVRLMNEIVSGIQVIKMYAWELPFQKLIEAIRKLEVNEIKKISFLRGLNGSISLFLIRSSMFVCVLTYVLTGNQLQAEYVYVVQSFYNALRQPITVHLPKCFALLGETKVSIQRVQNFLLIEEIIKKPEQLNDVFVQMKNVTVKWSSAQSDNTLTNINFNLQPKEIVAIIGPVGSGKSTILHTILQEVTMQSGTIAIKGRISYASQEPWLFSASLRQNILFGEDFDLERYNLVVKVCSLEKDFTLLAHGDQTIVGERGVMLSGGQKARVNLARAIYKKADIYLLDDPLSAVDAHVGKELFNECVCNFLQDKSIILVTHQLQYLSKVNHIYLVESGTITASGTYEEVLRTECKFLQLLNENIEEHCEKTNNNNKLVKKKSNKIQDEFKEYRSTGGISNRIYWKYFQSGGSCIVPFIIVVLFVLAQVFASATDYFLGFWVNVEQDRNEAQTLNHASDNVNAFYTSNNCLIVYTMLLVGLIVVTLTRSCSFVVYTLSIAKKLHNQMFDQVIKATMRFFNINTSGRILNRFGKDISQIDENLRSALTDTVQPFLEIAGIAVIISKINPWIILPTLLLFGLFYYYKTVYLSTSRDLKRLEATNRSLIFSHLSQSLQGLPTIRAFQKETVLKNEFDQHQNSHSSAFYPVITCERTFAFWLDMHSVIYTGLIIFSFLFLETETYGGNVGLAITQAISLTTQLQRGTREWSILENQMTSVERVIEYTNLPSEDDNGKKKPPTNWPSKGSIKFQSLYTKYANDLPYIIKNLTVAIKPGEKVGIVGRTGAGKSTLSSAIFRLAINKGTILVDDINITQVKLETLRQKISIIPQEPILFSGTLRNNLDPFNSYCDEELWNVLEEVELKEYVNNLAGGLTSNVSENGSNFSVGQRQLLCLARAIVRKNRILIMDEATANVDFQTDELIQTTIRNKFNECTVLTIAHRLNTIIDSDRILVMEGGENVEFNHPYLLLQNKNGVFYDLVQETGQGDALLSIAEQCYLKKQI